MKTLLGLLGSIFLLTGVFTPLVSLPILGNVNYFQNGEGDGTLVLSLAIMSFVLVLIKRFGGLYFTGIGSLAATIVAFVNIQNALTQAKADLEAELAGNPFRGLAELAMQSMQLQWGWALLILGSAMLIASAAIRQDA